MTMTMPPRASTKKMLNRRPKKPILKTSLRKKSGKMILITQVRSAKRRSGLKNSTKESLESITSLPMEKTANGRSDSPTARKPSASSTLRPKASTLPEVFSRRWAVPSVSTPFTGRYGKPAGKYICWLPAAYRSGHFFDSEGNFKKIYVLMKL